MDDRQLLEDAAKAAGLTVHAYRQRERDECGHGHVGLWIVNGSTCWNPLQDDAAALRLAVKLRLCIEHKEKHVVVWDGCIGTGLSPCEDDPEAATRRAITRAAAEMWRAQQEEKQ